MRYRITLLGDPNMDAVLRAKYIAAFGADACYTSEVGTFDCFYKEWPKACAEVVKVGEVSGNAPYDKGYTCQPDGIGNYWLQTGSDTANRTWVYYEDAKRQTPRVEVDGVPTEVSGPYRNLMEPPTVGPGQPFECNSGMVGVDGKPLSQRKWILQVNRKAHGGLIHSDLAGFTWSCTRVDENCKEVEEQCEEPLVLADPETKIPPFDPGLKAQVHHVVPMKDKRSCSWGTNSNKNAAVISTKLNNWLSNKNPPAEEVKQLNNAPAYSP